jgi:plasmid stabilization system protein ParE
VVFYKISEKYIDIIGIPHKSMDIENYFEDNI